MADVTVIHSVVIKATGSTATETVVFLELIVTSFDCGPPKLGLLLSVVEDVSVSCIEDAGESVVASDACTFTVLASLLIPDLNPGAVSMRPSN
jgi:hypothetical protein